MTLYVELTFTYKGISPLTQIIDKINFIGILSLLYEILSGESEDKSMSGRKYLQKNYLLVERAEE